MTISEEGRAAYEGAARTEMAELKRRLKLVVESYVILNDRLANVEKTLIRHEGELAALRKKEAEG